MANHFDYEKWCEKNFPEFEKTSCAFAISSSRTNYDLKVEKPNSGIDFDFGEMGKIDDFAR